MAPIVGATVYPEPGLVIVILLIMLELITGIPVAVVPEVGEIVAQALEEIQQSEASMHKG